MSSTGTRPLEITEAQKQQYAEEGYFILESALDDEQLEYIRGECDRLRAEMEAEMARKPRSPGITHKGSRYFISNRHRDNPSLRPYIFSEIMAEICRSTLGDTAYLFHEQFVVKGPEVGMKFGWHQDSGYVGFDHRPYMSCWAALDDVSEENGTVFILPSPARVHVTARNTAFSTKPMTRSAISGTIPACPWSRRLGASRCSPAYPSTAAPRIPPTAGDVYT